MAPSVRSTATYRHGISSTPPRIRNNQTNRHFFFKDHAATRHLSKHNHVSNISGQPLEVGSVSQPCGDTSRTTMVSFGKGMIIQAAVMQHLTLLSARPQPSRRRQRTCVLVPNSVQATRLRRIRRRHGPPTSKFWAGLIWISLQYRVHSQRQLNPILSLSKHLDQLPQHGGGGHFKIPRNAAIRLSGRVEQGKIKSEFHHLPQGSHAPLPTAPKTGRG
ncbi:hypothetical protein BAY15_2925 [Stenotrophomonas rhizophila]|nr:hypothetical protein BAY15_2925 [Stenotrophomonas rhizophila]